MAEARAADNARFSLWAKDQPMEPEATAAELARWEALDWIIPAEEGFALTVIGRREAGLPVGPIRSYVIDLEDARLDRMPHATMHTRCVKCGWEWQTTAPLPWPSELQCPECTRRNVSPSPASENSEGGK